MMATASPSKGKSVPVWWLAFAAAFYFPIWATGGLVMLITLPAQVAACVPAARKATAMGLASSIGSSAQFAQPFVGALSDYTRRMPFGGRRTYVVLGQLVTVVGLAIMMVTTHFWPLTAGFTLMMLGNSICYGAYPSILAELVPEHQVGVASGWAGFFQQSGLLFGSLLGFATGQGLSLIHI